jgi:glucose-1-phosphate thymidylyltransferase
MSRKGIILAGGTGTRLFPLTKAVSKQLMPVYDKPMIYYPLSVLMLAGIRRVLIITTPHEQDSFRRLLRDGRWLGMDIRYAVQPQPKGIAEAFLVAREFIGKDSVTLILGDNIYYGHGLPEALSRAASRKDGATVFGYQVGDPQRYGVIDFDRRGRPLSIEEKPKKPRSNYAVTGLYFYDNNVVRIAENLKPSARGELEITDVNRAYLRKGKLRAEKLGRGIAWLDTGTHESLLQAGTFIQTIQERQGLKVACVEEIAYHKRYINADQLREAAEPMRGNEYGRYLMKLAQRS